MNTDDDWHLSWGTSVARLGTTGYHTITNQKNTTTTAEEYGTFLLLFF